MRGMFRRKLKDFAELQQEQQEDVPLFERLKMKNFENESADELLAKDEFRRMVMTKPLPPAKKMYIDDVKETDYPTSGLDVAVKGALGGPK